MTSRIIAIANQKGGVGKTTFTLGLAGAIANDGRRVLVIDMDPQANASSTLLPDLDELLTTEDFFTVNDILDTGVEPGDLADAITTTPWPNVDVIPSQQALANRDTEGSTGIEYRLRRMLTGLEMLDAPYDVVLIDCPPSVGRLTVNSLLAAQEILLISGPDKFSHNALTQIDETLNNIRTYHMHDIKIAGLAVNMYENTNEANLRTEQLRERFGKNVLLVMPKRTLIPTVTGDHRSIFSVPGEKARTVAALFTELATTMRLVGKKAPAVRKQTAKPAVAPSGSVSAAVGY